LRQCIASSYARSTSVIAGCWGLSLFSALRKQGLTSSPCQRSPSGSRHLTLARFFLANS
jgi:hypothetical protein